MVGAVAWLLAGCGSVEVEDPVVSDGLDCPNGTRVGWSLDRGEPVAGFGSPEAAVRADVGTGGAHLIVGEERGRGDTTAVEVIVARGGRAEMRVEVWRTDRGWLADHVEACG